jgi:hypothetical protein
LIVILSGCPRGSPTTPSIDFSGNWTMTNTTLTTTSPALADIGATTTAKCNIVDNNGSLTINNFRIVGQEFINWEVGYRDRPGNNLAANVSGSYLNTYRDPLSLTLYFEGDIKSNGISGTGTWTQTFNIYGYIDTVSGTTIFVKG